MRARLLDTKSAAKLLGCTPAALIKFRAERRGPAYVRVGRLIRYRHADLARWLRSCRIAPHCASLPSHSKRGIAQQ